MGEQAHGVANERHIILTTLARAVEAMADVLPPDTEVVLHDFARLPNSLVAISGSVTGRRVGDPITDYLLAKLTRPNSPDHQSYPTRLPDGRALMSHTTMFRDSTGEPLAALCSNVDTTRWQAVQQALDFFLHSRAVAPADLDAEVTEGFPHDLDELRSTVLDRAVEAVGVPVDLMRKHHKLQVVEQLREQGFFTLRDAVPSAAAALRVTRFTIYNYLRELETHASTPQVPNA